MTDLVPICQDSLGRPKKFQSGDILKDEAGNILNTWTPAYYFGELSANAVSVMVWNDNVISSGITMNGSGVFTVTNAGIYQVNATGSTGSASAGIELRAPAASTVRARFFVGTANNGQDNGTLVGLISLAASGTFDLLNIGGFNIDVNTHISITRVA